METLIKEILIGIFTGIFTWLFSKSWKEPKIIIGLFQENQNYFNITNLGEDILNLKITISWSQDGRKEEREMKNFLNNYESPDSVKYSDHSNCTILKYNETKKVFDCPKYSDDWKVEIFITGTNINNEPYNNKKPFILKNYIKK